ncbi:hypothetical protein FRB94_009230 [Tulasnella sp. JGI-2019a]|nr:hypothetical protein FRB94_009230 [Tulasnella sp. JGI-2019a]KAG9016487.1 hypothetical protein FRB93_010736 [Tulasnella sp. JGI-2019a]KAG9030571.1 hypothetical protein FRB95_003832 [Tulasnella sp. JGI-2019a]
MQSHGGVTFFSANAQRIVMASTDVLETKAIAEYERDRKRALKGHDTHTKRKGPLVVVDSNVVMTNNKHTKSPAWKRAGAEEKERRMFNGSRFVKRDLRAEREEEDDEQWVEEAEEVERSLDKENRPSVQSISVRLEELVVRAAAAKGSKKISRPLTSRPSTPRQISPATHAQTPFPNDLLQPLMDTINTPPRHGTTTNDFDDGSFDFEFSSPDADEWTVAAIEDGGLRFATSSVAPPSSAFTVIVMPCAW